MAKLHLSSAVLIAVGCIAIIYGTIFIAWRAWRISRTFESVGLSLQSAASSLRDLAHAQSRLQELAEQKDLAAIMAGQNNVPAVAVNVVFDGLEIFPADPMTREIGMGVFTVRTVGGDAVFLLAIARSREEAVPSGPARLLAGFGERSLSLRLDPDDPPLDGDKATMLYADLLGRRWLRGFTDPQASRVPDAEPADSPQEATSQEATSQEASSQE
jgi:hypothetical protein